MLTMVFAYGAVDIVTKFLEYHYLVREPLAPYISPTTKAYRSAKLAAI
jgi:hypothetical protein